MEISTILAYLREEKILPSADWKCTAMSGGTMSEVYLLRLEIGMPVVVKINEEKVTKSEAEFLSFYPFLSLLPRLVAVDPVYRFIAYTYIPGSTDNGSGGNKKELLQALVSGLINQYLPVYSGKGWGRQDAPVRSWQQFLMERVKASEEVLNAYLKKKDLSIVSPSTRDLTQNSPKSIPYLIHGDCGVHNFILHEKRLAGVIDPTPVLGWPHDDLIYAFFSTPHELTKEALDAAFEVFTLPLPDRQQLYMEVLIGLYQRLAICVKHHPENFHAYLQAWKYWEGIVGREPLSVNKTEKNSSPISSEKL
ncbi:aminoglycoside phosphotransferase family protein [Planococcus sp. SE5232]|uniref:aminoglycoside phosphotransferase family protein n=1 Tax=unclassified Planococcus (in: firmicutes) TaxID=2662419 RepID=UPI003D6A8437